MLTATEIRARLSFDVTRLRSTARRIECVDVALVELQQRLEHRAFRLSAEARHLTSPELGGDDVAQLRYAQAQATAHLARRAALGELLWSSGRLALITAMAVDRWVTSLRGLSLSPASDGMLRAHIEAGRVAHLFLVSFRRGEDLKTGVGQLISAVVVAEVAHPENRGYIDSKIEEGLLWGRAVRRVSSDDEVLEEASRALRSAARLLVRVAERAEPGIAHLLSEADCVERRVEVQLARAAEER